MWIQQTNSGNPEYYWVSPRSHVRREPCASVGVRSSALPSLSRQNGAAGGGGRPGPCLRTHMLPGGNVTSGLEFSSLGSTCSGWAWGQPVPGLRWASGTGLLFAGFRLLGDEALGTFVAHVLWLTTCFDLIFLIL